MSLLPPNATELERALELLAEARLGVLAGPDLRDLWSAEACPEALLPWLAWALSIDQWDAAWSVEVKRARIGAAIAIQRAKGTRQSVSDMIASFGGDVQLREWFERTPPGVPHTFSMVVEITDADDDVPSAEFIDMLIAEVARTKPARSHFDFTVAVPVRGRIGTLAAARPAVLARISGGTNADPSPPNTLSLLGWPLTLGGDYLTIGA